MSRLLPFKSETTRQPDGTTVLSLEDEATQEALSALSSDTAREILSLVYEEPMTPPEIRDEIDTSLQNVHYHLENLEDAELIQPAGSGYSEKGTEMTVYAPASEAVVLFAGRETDRSRLKTALSRLIGAVGLLGLASLVVRQFARTSDESATQLSSQGGGDGGDAGAAGGDDAAETPGPTEEAADDAGALDAATATLTDGPTGTPPETPTPETQAGTPTPEATETVELFSTPTPTPTPTPGPTGTPGATGTPTATPTPQPTGTPTATPTPEPGTTVDPTVAEEGVRAAGDGGLLSDPAVTFFLGGAFMLAVVGVWWYFSG
jgi:DNA-binding transcriptional ArsR family regulator